jgi:hypothetical protein
MKIKQKQRIKQSVRVVSKGQGGKGGSVSVSLGATPTWGAQPDPAAVLGLAALRELGLNAAANTGQPVNAPVAPIYHRPLAEEKVSEPIVKKQATQTFKPLRVKPVQRIRYRSPSNVRSKSPITIRSTGSVEDPHLKVDKRDDSPFKGLNEHITPVSTGSQGSGISDLGGTPEMLTPARAIDFSNVGSTGTGPAPYTEQRRKLPSTSPPSRVTPIDMVRNPVHLRREIIVEQPKGVPIRVEQSKGVSKPLNVSAKPVLTPMKNTTEVVAPLEGAMKTYALLPIPGARSLPAKAARLPEQENFSYV